LASYIDALSAFLQSRIGFSSTSAALLLWRPTPRPLQQFAGTGKHLTTLLLRIKIRMPVREAAGGVLVATRIDIVEAARSCDLAICNGNRGTTTDMLLKPLPLKKRR
jgi:hypothetical protein